jgi:hypothetical protein
MLSKLEHETFDRRAMHGTPTAPDLTGAFRQCLSACKPSTRRAVELLLDVGAWNAASLLIAERELNGWQLRRLVFDDGEWVCSLSRQPQLPLELDDTADAHHDIAACAILHAIEEARARAAAAPKTHVPRSRQISQGAGYPVCCDNYA